MIIIRVDRQKIEVEVDQNLLEILKINKIDLPEYEIELPSGEVIKTALVEDSKAQIVQPADEIKAQDGMKISLNSGLARQTATRSFKSG